MASSPSSPALVQRAARILAHTPPALLRLRAPAVAFFLRTAKLAPTAGKALLALLLLLNVGSWPLVWHFRVLAPLAEFLASRRLLLLRHLFSSSRTKAAALEAYYSARSPVGLHPLRMVATDTYRATPDDCDFLLHLSNSSYAKAMDRARFRLAVNTFPNFMRCGGWAPLAATHFQFIREIPMFAPYEVRASVGAWDEKWIYVVSRFVAPPPSSKSRKSKSSSKSKSSLPDSDANEGIARALARAGSQAASVGGALSPEIGDSGANTPARTVTGAAVQDEGASGEQTAKALLARAVVAREADGAVLYTVTVAQLCYKFGRRTVPPAVILAANGFAAPLPSADPSGIDTTPTYSLAAPPPHWAATAALRASIPALTAFYAGGWREERWWEEALAGAEAERRERISLFGVLRGGMEGVRGVQAGNGA
ncbi:hypothetical protein B0H15DRAFT_933532 [Mycena belliarum]|uniref:Uncharacterized protein n=1 Tax=Mycena belliarum TaxID=1033014 RepID=A0AAD6TW43_9AGAR|nr:hypothetical protein B0H15DRAFT_933532 [Mycena belliae]